MKLSLKHLLVCMSIATLTGCTVPGSYIGAGDARKGVKMDGKQYKPQIIRVTPEIIASLNTGVRPKLLAQADTHGKSAKAMHVSYAPGQNANPMSYHYAIGDFDVLNIIVWDHPELSMPSSPIMGLGNQTGTGVTAYRAGMGVGNTNVSTALGSQSGTLVGPDGDIFFPYAGRFHVAGLTPDQLRGKIEQRLKRYINHPQVSVRVVSFRSQQVSVIGQVNVPGIAPITDKPLSLLGAINMAGGINQENADPKDIFVIRGDMYHPIIYIVDATSPEGLLLADHFWLKANDIVYVPATGITRFNKVISKILPTVQTIWFTRSVVKNV